MKVVNIESAKEFFSRLGSTLGMRPAAPKEQEKQTGVSAKFISKIASLESKLGMTEIFEWRYSGVTPAFIRFAAATSSPAMLIQKSEVASLAMLANNKLEHLFLDPKISKEEREYLGQRLNVPKEYIEEIQSKADQAQLENRLEKAIRNASVRNASSSALNEDMSYDAIRRKAKAFEDVELLASEKAKFKKLYPEDAATIFSIVVLEENAKGDGYNTIIRGVADDKYQEFYFSEPFDEAAFDDCLMSFSGPRSKKIILEMAKRDEVA